MKALTGNVKRTYDMIQKLSDSNYDPNLAAEALNSACVEAVDNGSTEIVQKCLEIFIDNIVKVNPPGKISNVKVDKVITFQTFYVHPGC